MLWRSEWVKGKRMADVLRRHILQTGLMAAVASGAAGALVVRKNMGTLQEYGEWMASIRRLPDTATDLSQLVALATLAPNSHNTQPWTFRAAAGNRLLLQPDLNRRTPVVDPDDHHLFVSLGCAAETLAVAAMGLGWSCDMETDASGEVTASLGPGKARPDALFPAIVDRQSTRSTYDARPVPIDDMIALVDAGTAPGINLALMTEPRERSQMRDLIVAANTAQTADPEFRAELKSWMRYNPTSAMNNGDGLLTAATGNPSLPDWIGPRAFDLFYDPDAETDKIAQQVTSSSGLAVFVAEESGPQAWVQVGRVAQRFLLTATARGIKSAFVNQPVEVAWMRPALAAMVGLPGQRPNLVVRFGYGPTLPYSPRRPVETVMA